MSVRVETFKIEDDGGTVVEFEIFRCTDCDFTKTFDAVFVPPWQWHSPSCGMRWGRE